MNVFSIICSLFYFIRMKISDFTDILQFLWKYLRYWKFFMFNVVQTFAHKSSNQSCSSKQSYSSYFIGLLMQRSTLFQANIKYYISEQVDLSLNIPLFLECRLIDIDLFSLFQSLFLSITLQLYYFLSLLIYTQFCFKFHFQLFQFQLRMLLCSFILLLPFC